MKIACRIPKSFSSRMAAGFFLPEDFYAVWFKFRCFEKIAMKSVSIFFLLLLPGIAAADIGLVYPQQAQCKSNMSTIQISGSRMRFDNVIDDRKYSMLFDGMEDMMTMLDHTERQYRQNEVDEDALDYTADVMSSTGTYIENQMKTVQAQMKQQCAQMEKQGMSCANMPDLSSMMQSAQSMAAGQMPVIEIKPSDKVQTVAGMACKTYDRYENGRKIREECYVEPKDLLMPEKDKKSLLRNMKVMHRFAKSMTGLTDKLMVGNNKASGLPDPADSDILLSQRCFAQDGSESGSIEAQITSTTIDASNFEIPPGYQVMKLMGD